MYGMGDYTKEESVMKKKFAMILATTLFTTAMLTGCAGDTAASDDVTAKVTMTAQKAEYEGDISQIKLTFTNNSDKSVYLGNDFTVEVRENEEWKELEAKDHFVTDVQTAVNAGKELEREYGIADAYGTLAQGEYRIGVDVSFDEKMADDNTDTLYTEFEVK